MNPEGLPELRTFQGHFGSLTDPRVAGRTRHLLSEVVIVAVCGLLCGAEGWAEIEEYGRAKEPWFRTWLSLPGGIPSHDTFGRVFSLLDPAEFQACFRSWVEAVNEQTAGRLVAIDGKTSRRSHARSRGVAALHTVSAWSVNDRVVLGQVDVADKSSEVTAIPALLDRLTVEGATVTIDAAGCYKDIAAKIVERKADYVLALKGNQPTLLEEVRRHFSDADDERFPTLLHDHHVTDETGHGRHEIRIVDTIITPARIRSLNPDGDWANLRSIIRVQTRTPSHPDRQPETRYYLSSLSGDAATAAQVTRGHWAIENQLHWSLDVAFDDDHSRIRLGHAQKNLVVLRHIALTLLSQDTRLKRGIKVKRLKAGWDNAYLLHLLSLALLRPGTV